MMDERGSDPPDQVDSREWPAAFAKLRAQHEDLLRHVSHDLRTPLVALVLQAQILERSLGDLDPNRRRAAAIIAMTREFTAAIDVLVATARLESGLARFSPERLALPGLVGDVVDNAFPAQSQRVVVTVEADLPEVVADRHHLEALVRVLLGHALNASTSAVGFGMSRSGPELHVVVTYQGPPVEQIAENPGSREPRVVDGLHLARLIVGMHGGRLASGWAPAQGSTITVALPLGRDPTPR